MTQERRTVHLADYRPPPWLADTVDLRFDLVDTHILATSTVTYRRNPVGAGGPLLLDGVDLELIEARIDGGNIEVSTLQHDEDGRLVVESDSEEFELRIVTRLAPWENKSLEGIYVSGSTLCTQMEAQGFRRVTYFQDRPDVLSVYRTTIVADRGQFPVLLSNGDLVEMGDLNDNRHFATWSDPHPKPCYLFALVAGDLMMRESLFTTCSGREVSLRLFVEPGNEDKCDHALGSLARAMKWDEETWGREYDLNIYMIVAVNDFNAGAMENKGLNIFNSALVLALPETATDADYYNIESVIGHEYFHNWSGNRVTLRDWFQLSLKEGLTIFRDQEFSSDLNSRAVKRISDVRFLRGFQFPEDAGPMSHPIRPASFMKIDNFYTVTVYEKGAEVIRMIRTLVGEEAFAKGMDLYFGRHDGQAVTTDHFVDAMEDAGDKDLSQFRRWYEQAGTPVLKVQGRWDEAKSTYELDVNQGCPPTPGQEEKQPFHMPLAVGLLGMDGREIPARVNGDEVGESTKVLELTGESQTFRFEGVDRQPVPSLLRGFSAPVRVEYDWAIGELTCLLANDPDSFVRWEASQELATRMVLDLVAVRAGGGDFSLDGDFLDAFGQLLADDSLDPALVAETMGLPGESMIGDLMDEVDVVGIHEARHFVIRSLAEAHRERLHEIYERHHGKPYELNPESMGTRRLKNNCLAWLSAVGDEDAIALCRQQFLSATNMTDELPALLALVHLDCPQRVEAIGAFGEKWRDDPLVVNKWLAAQASSSLPGTLDDVKSLLGDDRYNSGNPNNIRSLIGTFARNPLRFHEESGEGYRFFADRILEIDAGNPLLAGRLVGLLNQWKRYDEVRRSKMCLELERILGSEGLSDNVHEVVGRALSS